ncbi:MAG: rRNA maturation RNase YbeY [Bacteroidales bacterium]|nr:rRNA maturation RNase YbeY [Bacteroidales bacterium]
MNILFFYEDIEHFDFGSESCKNWILKCIDNYNKVAGDLNFIFTSDNYLVEINKQYLNHDYYTDIITFDYCVENTISGDIYISVDRVRENAIEYKQTFNQELHRVIIHGVLHLLGLNDHSESDKLTMRQAENNCLKIINLLER